jgi:Citrate transporter.
MTLLRPLLTRVSEDVLLVALLLALAPLLLWMPDQIGTLHRLVDWKTIGALAGLLVLSRGLEDSGYLAHAGRRLLAHIHGERALAALLVLFAAGLSAVVTNDVALFIVVPLTLGLRAVAHLPIGRLVIFEALAVNAGSTLKPGRQPAEPLPLAVLTARLFRVHARDAPVGAGPGRVAARDDSIRLPAPPGSLPRDTARHGRLPLERGLLWAVARVLCAVFSCSPIWGHSTAAALTVIALYLFLYRRVLGGRRLGSCSAFSC